MTRAIADITWRRPKLVLGLLGVFVVVAGILGRGVEEHLQAAGFTDSDSESEIATEKLRDELGYDANPGLVVLAATRTTSKPRHHRPRGPRRGRTTDREARGTEFVGRAEEPAGPARARRGRDPGRAAPRVGAPGAIRTGRLRLRAGRRRRRCRRRSRSGTEPPAAKSSQSSAPKGSMRPPATFGARAR